MSTYFDTCDYCNKEYVPTRRGVQRFCKPTCRTMSHRKGKEKQLALSLPNSIQNENSLLPNPMENHEEKKNKVEKMSMAGVGNAFAANLIYDLGKGILKSGQKEENKPVTKRDLAGIIKHLERYQPIKNSRPNNLGQKPFFDMYTKTVVYRGMKNPFDTFI